MQVITPGHKYALASLEGGPAQVIQFIEKVPESPGSTKMKTVNDGTTNEEVLAMLIDRLEGMNAKLKNHHTENSIWHCQQALHEIEERKRERQQRGVEGTMEK